VITNPTLYSGYHSYVPQEQLLMSGEDQYLVSAGLDPSSAAGWPSYHFDTMSNNDFETPNPHTFNSSAFYDHVRMFAHSNSARPALSHSSTGDEHDSDYRTNTSPPSLVSQALSNADSEDYRHDFGFSAQSSYIDLPQLNESASPFDHVAAPPVSTMEEQYGPNPFSQGVLAGATGDLFGVDCGDALAVPFDESYGMKSAGELQGMADSQMQVAVVQSAPPSNVDAEEFLYMSSNWGIGDI
jgi:hypothetical protein